MIGSRKTVAYSGAGRRSAADGDSAGSSRPPAARPRRSGRAGAELRGEHFRWLTRPRRILLLLGAVWIVNLFDLGYTLLESTRGSFIEMNPVAARLLSAPPHALVIYKAVLVAASSAILLLLSRHRLVELGCWLLLAIYLYLATRWIHYYRDLSESMGAPAANLVRVAG